MRKNNTMHGITIEKDIELRMSYRGATPWYYYLIQCIFISIVSISSVFCFISCFDILVDEKQVVLGISLLSIWFMGMFLFGGFRKWIMMGSIGLYAIVGYLFFDQILESSIVIANLVIEAYNQYFNRDILELAGSFNGETYDCAIAILFYMCPVIGIIAYSMIVGRIATFYVILTVPIVFIGFIVGKVPHSIAYVGYIGGTISVLAMTISERAGLFSREGQEARKKKKSCILVLDKTRIGIQMFCFLLTFGVLGISYMLYPPTRYEEEVDVVEIKANIQETMKEITSGSLFEGTLFDDMFGQRMKHANAGLSNGKLGRVGNLRYNNTTALKITTQRLNNGTTEYIKGYVGETYTSSQWGPLSSSDARGLAEFEEAYLGGDSVENLPAKLFRILRNSPYNYYEYLVKSMQVENVSAANTVSYVPYLLGEEMQISDGKIQTGSNTMMYYSMSIDQFPGGKDALNRTYQYLKINTILQMNLINVKVLEQWEEKEEYLEEEVSNVLSIIPSIEKEEVIQTGNISVSGRLHTMGLFSEALSVMEFMEVVQELHKYSAWENWYYHYVTDVYTKLPQGQLEKVHELVQGREVSVNRTNTGGETYTYLDEIDAYAELKQLYQRIQEGTVNGQELWEQDWYDYDDTYIQQQYYEAIEFVQEYLAQNTSYTLNPGKTPSNEDFVEYFLFQNKKGYCMHYASAATVMLRAMGVPARYAEGYVVTQGDYNNASLAGYSEAKIYNLYTNGVYLSYDLVTIDVKDTNAHAWVEVYLPGLGWQPIEMTSPYSIDGNIEIPPINENPTATLKPTPVAVSTPRPTSSVKPSTAPSTVPTTKPTVKPGATQTSNKHSLFDGVKDWYKGLSIFMRRSINVISMIGILLMLTIVIVVLRQRIILLLRKRKEATYNYNEKALSRYRMLQGIYEAHDVKLYSGVKKEAFMKAFVNAYPFVNEEGGQHYVELILKARYGQGILTKEEFLYVEAFHKGFIERVYRDASKPKRWYYKYILVMM